MSCHSGAADLSGAQAEAPRFDGPLTYIGQQRGQPLDNNSSNQGSIQLGQPLHNNSSNRGWIRHQQAIQALQQETQARQYSDMHNFKMQQTVDKCYRADDAGIAINRRDATIGIDDSSMSMVHLIEQDRSDATIGMDNPCFCRVHLVEQVWQYVVAFCLGT